MFCTHLHTLLQKLKCLRGVIFVNLGKIGVHKQAVSDSYFSCLQFYLHAVLKSVTYGGGGMLSK